MATIQLTLTTQLPITEITKNQVKDLLCQYLRMKYPIEQIMDDMIDDKIIVYHEHLMKVIKWLVLHQIQFTVLDYD